MIIVIYNLLFVPKEFYSFNNKEIQVLNSDSRWCETKVKSNYLLLFFYSDYCGSCSHIKPTIYRLADEFSGLYLFLPLNISDENNFNIKKVFHFRYIPAVFIVNHKLGKYKELEFSDDYEYYRKNLIEFSNND